MLYVLASSLHIPVITKLPGTGICSARSVSPFPVYRPAALMLLSSGWAKNACDRYVVACALADSYVDKWVLEVRISTVGGETGTSDEFRDPRGFAVK